MLLQKQSSSLSPNSITNLSYICNANKQDNPQFIQLIKNIINPTLQTNNQILIKESIEKIKHLSVSSLNKNSLQFFMNIYQESLSNTTFAEEILQNILQVLNDKFPYVKMDLLELLHSQLMFKNNIEKSVQKLIQAYQINLLLKNKITKGFRYGIFACQLMRTKQFEQFANQIIVYLKAEIEKYSKPMFNTASLAFSIYKSQIKVQKLNPREKQQKMLQIYKKRPNDHKKRSYSQLKKSDGFTNRNLLQKQSFNPYGTGINSPSSPSKHKSQPKINKKSKQQILQFHLLLYEIYMLCTLKVPSDMKKKYFKDLKLELKGKIIREFPGINVEQLLFDIQLQKLNQFQKQKQKKLFLQQQENLSRSRQKHQQPIQKLKQKIFLKNKSNVNLNAKENENFNSFDMINLQKSQWLKQNSQKQSLQESKNNQLKLYEITNTNHQGSNINDFPISNNSKVRVRKLPSKSQHKSPSYLSQSSSRIDQQHKQLQSQIKNNNQCQSSSIDKRKNQNCSKNQNKDKSKSKSKSKIKPSQSCHIKHSQVPSTFYNKNQQNDRNTSSAINKSKSKSIHSQNYQNKTIFNNNNNRNQNTNHNNLKKKANQNLINPSRLKKFNFINRSQQSSKIKVMVQNNQQNKQNCQNIIIDEKNESFFNINKIEQHQGQGEKNKQYQNLNRHQYQHQFQHQNQHIYQSDYQNQHQHQHQHSQQKEFQQIKEQQKQQQRILKVQIQEEIRNEIMQKKEQKIQEIDQIEKIQEINEILQSKIRQQQQFHPQNHHKITIQKTISSSQEKKELILIHHMNPHHDGFDQNIYIQANANDFSLSHYDQTKDNQNIVSMNMDQDIYDKDNDFISQVVGEFCQQLYQYLQKKNELFIEISNQPSMVSQHDLQQQQQVLSNHHQTKINNKQQLKKFNQSLKLEEIQKQKQRQIQIISSQELNIEKLEQFEKDQQNIYFHDFNDITQTQQKLIYEIVRQWMNQLICDKQLDALICQLQPQQEEFSSQLEQKQIPQLAQKQISQLEQKSISQLEQKQMSSSLIRKSSKSIENLNARLSQQKIQLINIKIDNNLDINSKQHKLQQQTEQGFQKKVLQQCNQPNEEQKLFQNTLNTEQRLLQNEFQQDISTIKNIKKDLNSHNIADIMNESSHMQEENISINNHSMINSRASIQELNNFITKNAIPLKKAFLNNFEFDQQHKQTLSQKQRKISFNSIRKTQYQNENLCCGFGTPTIMINNYPSTNLLGSNIGLTTKKSIIKSDSKIRSKKILKQGENQDNRSSKEEKSVKIDSNVELLSGYQHFSILKHPLKPKVSVSPFNVCLAIHHPSQRVSFKLQKTFDNAIIVTDYMKGLKNRILKALNMIIQETTDMDWLKIISKVNNIDLQVKLIKLNELKLQYKKNQFLTVSLMHYVDYDKVIAQVKKNPLNIKPVQISLTLNESIQIITQAFNAKNVKIGILQLSKQIVAGLQITNLWTNLDKIQISLKDSKSKHKCQFFINQFFYFSNEQKRYNILIKDQENQMIMLSDLTMQQRNKVMNNLSVIIGYGLKIVNGKPKFVITGKQIKQFLQII